MPRIIVVAACAVWLGLSAAGQQSQATIEQQIQDYSQRIAQQVASGALTPAQAMEQIQQFAAKLSAAGNAAAAPRPAAGGNRFCANCSPAPPELLTCVQNAGVEAVTGSHVFRNTCTVGVDMLYADPTGMTDAVLPPGGTASVGGFHSGSRPYKLFVCPEHASAKGAGNAAPSYQTLRYECAPAMDGSQPPGGR